MEKRHEYNLTEGLIGEEARIVSILEPQDEAQYLVKVRGELWKANSPDNLKVGEKVKILSFNRLILIVRRDNVR